MCDKVSIHSDLNFAATPGNAATNRRNNGTLNDSMKMWAGIGGLGLTW